MSLPPFNPNRTDPVPDPPGKGDDVACFACGAKALDTGLECDECGADNYEAVTGKPFGSAPSPSKQTGGALSEAILNLRETADFFAHARDPVAARDYYNMGFRTARHAAADLAASAATKGKVFVSISKVQELMDFALGRRMYGQDDLQRLYNELAREIAASPQAHPARMLTDEQIYDWWASENGMEDFDLCKMEHFCKVVRAVEQKLAGEQAHPDTKRLDWIAENWGAWCGSELPGLFHGRDWAKREWLSAPTIRAAIDAAIQGGNPTNEGGRDGG